MKMQVAKVFSFYYGLSEREVNVLLYLAKNGAKTVEDLEKELGLSAQLINKYLVHLYEKGFIKRTKDTTNKVGRPRYIYFVQNLEELKQRIATEIRQINEKMIELVEKELT